MSNTEVSTDTIAPRTEEYRRLIIERASDPDHEHLYVTSVVYRCSDPTSTCFELDPDSMVAWVPPHCAVCGKEGSEENECLPPV